MILSTFGASQSDNPQHQMLKIVSVHGQLQGKAWESIHEVSHIELSEASEFDS